MVLERFLFLCSEESGTITTIDNVVHDRVLRDEVWQDGCFKDNLNILLEEGNCWRLKNRWNRFQKRSSTSHVVNHILFMIP
jgi:hypothetical protein